MGRQKIAVLGGGAGSMAAVYGITSEPGWDQRYEITVYQLGWRLGGKGASGRDPSPEGRYANVEHGFHLFGGFYHNTFNMLRPVYQEWPGVAGARPIPWEQAFIAHDLVSMGNETPEGWGFASIVWPHLPGEIGVGGTELTPETVMTTMVVWLNYLVAELLGIPQPQINPDTDVKLTVAERIERAPLLVVQAALDEVIKEIEATRDRPVGSVVWKVLIGLLDTAIGALRLLDDLFPPGKDGYPVIEAMEIALVCLRGMLEADVFTNGFDACNPWELRDWLARNGASERAMNSFIVRSGYDYTFAFKDGDPANPWLAAGVALRGLLRLMMTYHGSIFWHLNGGMGEIVFTPLYEVLKARGVKFRFFTRITDLQLDADGASVEKIKAVCQAVPKAGTYDYDPLALYPQIDRKYWPLEPDFSQLVNGDALRPLGTAWENYWVRPESDQPISFTRGVDFDWIILGISVGALDTICADLRKKLPAWDKMLAAQMAIPTYGIQYWMKPDVHELGWPGDPTVLTAYQEPMSTWADMSFLLSMEQAAPDGSKPKSLSYFCGAMPAPAIYPPPPDPGFPPRELAEARVAMDEWLDRAILTMWPNSGWSGGPGLDPALIYSTVFKANIDPSERYVLSPPDRIKDRFKADQSGVANLFLAGDWIKTGLDAGAFEAAVMGGLECAAALSGVKIKIYGETDF